MNKLYLHKNKMRLGQLPFIGVMFGFLFFSAFVHGQSTNTISLDVPQVVPVSPTVAAMEKYQSYPVSHCTVKSVAPSATIFFTDCVQRTEAVNWATRFFLISAGSV